LAVREPTDYELVLAALMAAPGCKAITEATGTVLFMPTVPARLRELRRRRLPPLPVGWTIRPDESNA
jgi:hypothetical protein